MTFVSMSTYLLRLITQDIFEHKYCHYWITMGFGMSILILVANSLDTQMFQNFDDFILHSCAYCMNFGRNLRFLLSKHCQKQKIQRLELPRFFRQSSSQNGPEHVPASNYEGMATMSLFVSLHGAKTCQIFLGL